MMLIRGQRIAGWLPIHQSSESEPIKDPRKNMNDLPIEHGVL